MLFILLNLLFLFSYFFFASWLPMTEIQTHSISRPSFDLTFLLIFNQFHPLTSITIYFPVYVLDMFIASDLLVPWRRPTYYYIYTANGNISFVRRDAILQADLKLHRYTHAKSCLIQHLDNTALKK